MELFRHVLGGVCLLFGSLVIIASYIRQISNFRRRHQQDGGWSSPAPFIGPALVIFGYFALPIDFSNWIFLAIVLDPDTLLTIVSIPYILKAIRE